MKILFVKNVSRQGVVGQVKDVPQGFAQFLIANGSAVVATEGVQKQNAVKIEEANLKAKGDESMAHEIAKRVDGKIFKLKAGPNNKGNLYKAVHKQEVLEAISKEIVVTVPESLLGDVNIKLTGNHKMNLVFKGKTLAVFQVEIV